MTPHPRNSTTWHFPLVAALVMLAVVFVLGCSKKEAPATAEAPQTTFNTPAEAGQVLQAAVLAKDESAITRILGPNAKRLVSSGDPAVDSAALESFAKKYDRMNRLVVMTDGSQVLYIGADNYPFPIPLAQDSSSKWHFDAAAGDEELRTRRIGRDELLAIDGCTLMANAEELYRRGAHQYTDTIISTPGKQDGLYWEAPTDQAPSPLGALNQFAKGVFTSGAPNKTPVFHGYSFRVLTAQGKAAKSGARSYLVNGKMTGGFAIVASPVNYRHSGIMTFILSREGVVYQQDLGPNTADIAASIKEYNPTDEWMPAE
jgi:hypothetical protein